MGSSPEEFVELRRLLAAKRAELPPPGYFNTFAGKVVARIEAEGLAAPKPWWVRWVAAATASSSLAAGNTAIIAGMAVLGGTAWYFKARPDRRLSSETARRVPGQPTGAAQAAFPLSGVPSAQLAGFNSLPFTGGGSPRLGFVQSPPVLQFQIRQPSLRDRVDTAETDGIPSGIFEPWNTSRAAGAAWERGLPTSIVHHVEGHR